MRKFILSRERMPTIGKLVYGVIVSYSFNYGFICAWDGCTWGAHVHVIKWRPLTLFERFKLATGIIKPYKHLGVERG